MGDKKSFKEWLKQFASGKAKPDTSTTATASVYDRYSEYPSNGLTPEKLSRIFKAADTGDVMAQMELFEEIEEKDPHLFSQLQTRKNAVTGLDYEIVAASDSEFDKTVATFIENAFAEIEDLNDILFDLLDAIGKGIAISEIVWGYSGQAVVVKDIKRRHQKRLFWDHEDNMLIRAEDQPQGMPIPTNKFIIHKYKARSGHPARAGVLRVVAWMYLFKNYDVKDWVRFCELFGMPLRLGKYNPGASEEDKISLMEALVSLGVDAAGILPEGTSIELKDSEKTTSVNLYESLARYCDEQMSKAILGQTLTSDTGGGSYAQSKTHNEVRHDLTVADCKALAGTLKRDLIKPLVYFNFGNVQAVPEIRFDCKEPEDLKVESEILDKLINNVGLKVPMEYLYKKFGIPQPEDGDAVASRQVIQVSNMVPEAEEKITLKVLKDEGLSDQQEKSQEEIDNIIDKSAELSKPLFKKMFEPIMEMTDKASTLEELKEQLEDKEYIKTLFNKMDVRDFEELLQRSMMAADLTGRVMEDER